MSYGHEDKCNYPGSPCNCGGRGNMTKVEITFKWRSWKPRYRLLRKYKQLHLSWLWFFVCIERVELASQS